MDYRITPEDRARFKRCRRQWDFASPHRRDLEGEESPETPALATAFRDALAVYYYPGTWDWPHEVKQSLVYKAMRRTLEEGDAEYEIERGTALIDLYDAWAATVDDFAPVKIAHDVTALVLDPTAPDMGLLTSNGEGIVYDCRVDLLTVDAADEYWVMKHELVGDWRSTEELVLDEEVTAACWAWEQDYIGMEIAGTIHNEIRLDAPVDIRVDVPAATDRPTPVAQHEASGGGRSIPQHVRRAARDSRPVADRIEQRSAGMLRRSRIRRGRNEIAAAGSLMAAEAAEMSGAPVIYPSPGSHCLACEFRSPCFSLFEGLDPEPALARDFHRRPGELRHRPRLGQTTWGFGRGAAPPDW
jgi:hypothetical protein